MALKPTIYKIKISLSDLNRNYYDTLNLTIAQHPSETIERMMVRMLAYCINVQEHLTFTKGLSSVEEADIWARSYDDQILLWIDVGEPSIDRVKKVCRLANEVKVYCFNSKADVWWEQSQEKILQMKAAVYKFDWVNIKTLAGLVERTMEISISITGDTAYIATEQGEAEVNWQTLKS